MRAKSLRAVLLLAASHGIGESLLRDNADEVGKVSAGADEVVLCSGIAGENANENANENQPDAIRHKKRNTMTAETQYFLAIVSQMIGTLTIEPSKINHMGVGAPRGTQADTFNELMDAAIVKAHQVMAEATRYEPREMDHDEMERLRRMVRECNRKSEEV